MTEGEIIEATKRRSWGQTYTQIGMEMRIKTYQIRKHLIPGFVERKRELALESRVRLARHTPKLKRHHVPSGLEIPQQVLSERDRLLSLQPRNLTAAFCGDPLPGRSALDRRAGHG